MTQEEKQLLLRDLCGRVPYVTFVYVDWHETEELEICEGCEEEEEPNIHTLISCNYYGECDLDDNLCKTIYDIKPYLRPMSSMTDEEKEEYHSQVDIDIEMTSKRLQERFETGTFDTENQFTPQYCHIDWLNENHFDYRGLIEKGLALEAPEGMYKI